MSDEKRTLVEEGTELRGSLTSSCPVVVRGKVSGEVSTPSLTVSESGSVQGKAKVGILHASGEIAGEFDADTVELAGTVKDGTILRAKTLSVKLTAQSGKMSVTFGETSLEVGDEPSRAEALGDGGGGGGKKKKGQGE
jgi:cytoskeletal protein CcmA (bactofilin family)